MLSLSSSSSSTGMSAFKCCGSNCPQSLLDFNVRRARHFRICSLMPTGPSTSTRRSSDHFGPGGRDADLHLGPLALTLIAGVSIFTSIPCAILALSKSLDLVDDPVLLLRMLPKDLTVGLCHSTNQASPHLHFISGLLRGDGLRTVSPDTQVLDEQVITGG